MQLRLIFHHTPVGPIFSVPTVVASKALTQGILKCLLNGFIHLPSRIVLQNLNIPAYKRVCIYHTNYFPLNWNMIMTRGHALHYSYDIITGYKIFKAFKIFDPAFPSWSLCQSICCWNYYTINLGVMNYVPAPLL